MLLSKFQTLSKNRIKLILKASQLFNKLKFLKLLKNKKNRNLILLRNIRKLVLVQMMNRIWIPLLNNSKSQLRKHLIITFVLTDFPGKE